ncbi:cell surface glycoprotein CD200 receptor 2-like [Vulpes vulpes]|uniref:Cell surface glycoprotein CD200 receptor 2-like n=1 Tax=Vulpes vulpes TaxID=9627 RepID=A0A3Q7SVG2_VULVU
MHTPGRTSTLSVLISINIMVSALTNILPVERKQKSITPPVEANTSLSVFVDTRVVLHCPNATSDAVIVTWAVTFRNQTSCSRDYRTDNNKTSEKTCTDERISWDFRPDQNFALQINPVAITHEGYYKCEVITPDGNFGHGHHLRVLVPPKVTLSLGENGTTICWAVAGSPAAQISWTPTGDCHTVEERLGNDTVTVQSTCHWEDRQVSEVSCFVSHVTGNKSLSIELNQGAITLEFPASALLVILYVKFSLFLVIILVIVGFTYFQRINHCRA